MPHDNRFLLSAVQAWAAENYPGLIVRRIDLHFCLLPDPVQLVNYPAAASGVAQEETSEDEETEVAEERQRASGCIADILEILERAKRPMTTMRLIAALERAGKIWSKRTLDNYLAEMVRDGTLVKGTPKNPGYALPEWGNAEPNHPT